MPSWHGFRPTIWVLLPGNIIFPLPGGVQPGVGRAGRAQQTLDEMRQMEVYLPDSAPTRLTANILQAHLYQMLGEWDAALGLYQEYIEEARG